jgi:hypothetical protein
MAGPMEERGRMSEYWNVMSDSEDEDEDEDGGSELDNDKSLNNTEAVNIPEGSTRADITGNSLLLGIPALSLHIGEAEAFADVNAERELRRLPRDFLPFARWAFGPEGISSLKVLAYGDFSLDGQFDWHNHIFCRKEWTVPRTNSRREGREEVTLPCRPIRDSDTEMRELVERNMDFLQACPHESIVIESDY